MKCTVKLIWDYEARVWITESDDIPGLLLESSSFDTLIERVRMAAPEMLELNRNYVGPVSLSFEAERVETAWAVDSKIKSRHMANAILKESGIKERFR